MAALRSALLVALAFAASALVAEGKSIRGGRVYFHGAGKAVPEEVTQALAAELAAGGERLARLEEELRQLFVALPKNEHGNLGHDSVRYALHRYFLNRHGWFIRGLEPRHGAAAPSPSANSTEWVPAFLQESLERRAGDRGAALHDVAALAAALEDLIKHEALARLNVAYEAHDISNTTVLLRDQVSQVLMTYFISFLVGNNFTVGSYSELVAKKHRFASAYKNYTEVKAWFDELVEKRLGHRDVSKAYDFAVASEAVSDISEQYVSFNERECSSLKSTLAGIESRRPGRVRLSAFYNMSRYSHWQFTEKPEFLRAMGALDDSDPKNPSVIIPNYAMARTNCLDAFHLYSVCCRNACEDLMGSVERQLGAPSAEPQRLAALVAALASDSVEAPRELPAALVARLNEIAEHHGGTVPIHGRLFSQWMHHAYPMECPYPHEGVNPLTASEWLEASGHATTEASEEEMQRQVEADTCAVDWQGRPDCEGESTDLPWVMQEQLLARPVATAAERPEEPAAAAAAPAASAGLTMAVVLLAILGLAASLPLALAANRASRCASELAAALGERPRPRPRAAAAKVVALVCAAVLCYCAGLLDGVAVLGGLLFAAATSLATAWPVARRGKSV